MKTMAMIAVSRLYENSRVGQAFGINLASHIGQTHPLSDVAAGVLNGGVPVHVGQLTQTEAVQVIGRIRKAVNHNRGVVTVVDFPNARIEFVVCDGGPVVRLLKEQRHWMWSEIELVHCSMVSCGGIISSHQNQNRIYNDISLFSFTLESVGVA